MIHSNNPIIKYKAGLLNLAKELGNVSKACKVMLRILTDRGVVVLSTMIISFISRLMT